MLSVLTFNRLKCNQQLCEGSLQLSGCSLPGAVRACRGAAGCAAAGRDAAGAVWLQQRQGVVWQGEVAQVAAAHGFQATVQVDGALQI